MVALPDAWQKGAQAWDLTTRTAFANDPLNLLATDGPTNSAKGDGDAATSLPPSTTFRCHHDPAAFHLHPPHELRCGADCGRRTVADRRPGVPQRARPRR